MAAIRERVRRVEERLRPTAEKLKHIVAQKVSSAGPASPQRRRSYLEIFNATIPDPIDVELELE